MEENGLTQRFSLSLPERTIAKILLVVEDSAMILLWNANVTMVGQVHIAI